MKTLELSDAGRLGEELKSGDTIELVDQGKAVAKVVPIREETIEERIADLERQGKVTRGGGSLPDWFFEEKPPKFEGSVLEQLLEDRRKNDW